MSELKQSILQELSTKLSSLIEYHLGAEHIHHIQADGSGYYYYIQDLKPKHPVLAMHYREPLMLVLPYEDFQRLDQEEITVDDYIATSYFNYGYFWGGGDLIGGAYWQPFEQEAGVHDTERISRYLQILGCRTHKISCGYGPTEDRCQKCQLDATTCPFSPLNQTGSWENEVQEPDGRRKLFEAIDLRLKRELGFEWSFRCAHSDNRDEMCLFPGREPNTVEVYVSSKLLNDLLYHPHEDRDWQKMADELIIAIAKPLKWNYRVILPNDSACKREICLDFWRDEVAKWETNHASEVDGSVEDPMHRTTETAPGASKDCKRRNIFAAILGRKQKG